MTDPYATPPAPPAAPAPATQMKMPGFLASLGRAELFMAAGAALIVAVDLLFVVFGPYGFSNVAWAGAVLALMIIFLSGRMLSFSAATHRSLLLMLGAFAVLIGIRELLSDLQFLSGASVAVTYYLGAIGFYVGTAIMAFGAWQLWGRKA
ncbi:MAG: hypothetical protein ABI797_01760 [Chloroflexota bacterium]